MKTQMLTLAIVAAAFAATAQAARLRGASTTLSGCGCTCRCTGAACQFATDAAFAKGCADPSLRAKYGVKEGDSCTQLSTLANKMQSVVTFSDCAGTVDFPPTSASAGSAPLPLMPGPVIPTYGGAVLPPPFMPMPGPVVLPDAKTAVCGCICPGAVCEAIHKCTPAARAAQLATCGVDGRRQLMAGVWKAVACPLMKVAAGAIIPSGGMVASHAICEEIVAEVLGECEAAGGGPEDPLADTCAAGLGTAMGVACEAALEGGFDLTSDYVVEHYLGC